MMNDYFALFGEPRRPWLDLEVLRAKFLGLVAAAHPDHVAGRSEADQQAAHQRSTELNAGYRCLREPKERLAHLLELERGARPGGIERVPGELMALFVRVGELCRGADAFLAERSGAESPVLKVQFFERGMEWADKLSELRRSLQDRQAQLETDLKAMNPVWEAAASLEPAERAARLPLSALEEIYRTLGYFARWTAQLHERIVKLSS